MQVCPGLEFSVWVALGYGVAGLGLVCFPDLLCFIVLVNICV